MHTDIPFVGVLKVKLSRKIMKRITALCAPLLFAASAQAIDIPMPAGLAAQALDSKTCYSTITHKGGIAGYELNGLLVSHRGQLLELPAVRHPRRLYRSEAVGIEVEIRAKTIRRRGNTAESWHVTEKGYMTIRENGQQKTIPIMVKIDCTP